jgi:ABC-type transporter Mla MlaB component
MDSKMEDYGDNRVLRLSGDLTVRFAAELKSVLSASLQNIKELTVDIDAAAEIDVSLFQLLCSAHKTSIGRSIRLSFDVDQPVLLGRAAGAGYILSANCAFNTGNTCLWKGVANG